MPVTSQYVLYSDSIEVKQPDEDKIIQEIVETFGRINRMMFDKHRHAVRDAHAKSHGIVKGELQIYDQLPETLKQGLFAVPKTYPVIIRFSTAPGDILPDGVSAFRGMAVKVIGVEGKKVLPEQSDALTQDFLLVSHPVIPTGTVSAYLKEQKKLEDAVKSPEEFQKLISSAARAVNTAVHKIGIKSNIAGSDLGIGEPLTHILGETFFSMASLRYGDYVAKISAAPFSENVKQLEKVIVDSSNDSALRDAVSDFFHNQTAEYELRVQLCTDLETMPVEDGSILWSEEQSPYLPVAKITISPQDTYSPARRVFADDVLSFNPWHCVPEHRPLGNIMRVRKKAYEASAAYRHKMNAQPLTEPESIDELPD